MKKYLFITILLLLLSGCRSGEVPAETAPDLSLNTATTTEEIDTSNWLTYKNEEYGFEFKYPKEWKIEIDTNNGPWFDLVIVNQENKLNISNTPRGYENAVYKNDITIGGKTGKLSTINKDSMIVLLDNGFYIKVDVFDGNENIIYKIFNNIIIY